MNSRMFELGCNNYEVAKQCLMTSCPGLIITKKSEPVTKLVAKQATTDQRGTIVSTKTLEKDFGATFAWSGKALFPPERIPKNNRKKLRPVTRN